MFGLDKKELLALRKLSSPIKIQDFLDSVPLNWEKKRETYMSPRRALRENKMHCLEGALVAAVALWLRGQKPLLLDLKANGDDDHVVALYKKNGYWGSISKTNHSTLRFRDPIYKNLRELSLSYFHEYFNDRNGKKSLRSYSDPYDLTKLGTSWITAEEDLDLIAEILDGLPHHSLCPAQNSRFIRLADTMERRAGKLIEWTEDDPRT